MPSGNTTAIWSPFGDAARPDLVAIQVSGDGLRPGREVHRRAVERYGDTIDERRAVALARRRDTRVVESLNQLGLLAGRPAVDRQRAVAGEQNHVGSTARRRDIASALSGRKLGYGGHRRRTVVFDGVVGDGRAHLAEVVEGDGSGQRSVRRRVEIVEDLDAQPRPLCQLTDDDAGRAVLSVGIGALGIDGFVAQCHLDPAATDQTDHCHVAGPASARANRLHVLDGESLER